MADMLLQPMDMVHTVKNEKLPFWAVFLFLKSHFNLIKNMDKNSIKKLLPFMLIFIRAMYGISKNLALIVWDHTDALELSYSIETAIMSTIMKEHFK
ncbi:hypothetical protein [Peribacillus sp. Hz7]|uniref:hypothetical protein n=1 Tax=Peribacillus sp. Hz7 TaxID=3344873 RepID=UPI0035C95D19